MSKKVLAYHGIRVPGFVTYRPGEPIAAPRGLRFPLIVKPLQSDASAGIAQASVVQDEAALADRVTHDPRALRPAGHRRGVRRRPRALREPHRQRRRPRHPADHRDGLRQAPHAGRRSGSPPSSPSGTRTTARGRGSATSSRGRSPGRRGSGSRRSAGPPSGPSGSATTPGSTSGSRPTARSGSSRPTPTHSSATATTWPTRRRRRGWTTTSSSSGWWTRRWRAMSHA